jgi:hypothetical protein
MSTVKDRDLVVCSPQPLQVLNEYSAAAGRGQAASDGPMVPCPLADLFLCSLPPSYPFPVHTQRDDDIVPAQYVGST